MNEQSRDPRRAPSLRMCSALLASALVAACSDEAPEPETPLRPVRCEQVFAQGGSIERSFSGAAEAGIESRLSFKVGGSIRDLPVNVGDRVQRGQLIARLDPRDYEIGVQEAEAALKNAEARKRNAFANRDRAEKLYENRNASRADWDGARATADSAAAEVAAAEKRLESAKLQLSYTRLTSPSDGAISEVNVEVNENVDAGREIAVLTAGRDIQVTVQIPEQLIAEVESVEKIEVSFDAIPGAVFEARTKEVGVTATGMATTFPVTVEVLEPDSRIRPGMAAVVTALFETASDRMQILVPAFAIGEDPRGRFVYVVEADPSGGTSETGIPLGVVRRRDVAVSGELPRDERLEITSGLEDGELLVTAGVSRIEDGLTVAAECLEGDAA